MARITNMELLAIATAEIGFDWDGENLFTYEQWARRGKQVKRGEKAILSTELWKPFTVIETKDGEEKKKTVFKLKRCYLFSDEQVKDAKERKR